jgi:GntR family transcriptional regulator, transcriptional repressor for pyruvate dehydrogenase complex
LSSAFFTTALPHLPTTGTEIQPRQQEKMGLISQWINQYKKDRVSRTRYTRKSALDKDTQRARPSYLPVQTKRAFEEVAEQIREQLSQGLLKPGDRLPAERDLAEQFNLSRNTVREALRSLEMSGVLEFRKGATGGAFVREGQSDAVVSGFSDLYRLGFILPEHLAEARLLIGVEVTRLACQRATEAEHAELEANLEASEKAMEDGDGKKRLTLNLEYHMILARAAKNPVLIILMEALNDLIFRSLFKAPVHAENTKIVASRRRILKFMRARDEEKAVAEMHKHLTALRKHYKAQEQPEAANTRSNTETEA